MKEIVGQSKAPPNIAFLVEEQWDFILAVKKQYTNAMKNKGIRQMVPQHAAVLKGKVTVQKGVLPHVLLLPPVIESTLNNKARKTIKLQSLALMVLATSTVDKVKALTDEDHNRLAEKATMTASLELRLPEGAIDMLSSFQMECLEIFNRVSLV